MLDGQPNARPFFRPFETAWHLKTVEWLRSDSYQEGMPQDLRSKFENEVKQEASDWQASLSKAEEDVGILIHPAAFPGLTFKQGNVLMVHTHSCLPLSPDRALQYMVNPIAVDDNIKANPTLIPDDLLLHPGTVPVLTIRHPRLVVPSAHRAIHKIVAGCGRPNVLLLACNVWTRWMYSFYVAHGIHPLIVDADDYMTSEDFVRKLCSEAGLDPDKAVFSWATTTDEQKESLERPYVAVQTSFLSSTSAKPDRAAKNVDLEKEEALWAEEFGPDLPFIQELVELSMLHYEYLYQRRLTL